MSVNLYRGAGESDDECLSMTHRQWSFARRLAEQFGWRPKGTGAPLGWSRRQNHPWNGRYDCNDGQLVYAADARRLGQALESAMVELPSCNYLEPEEQAKHAPSERIEILTWAEEEFLDELVLFCEEGQFRIS